MTELHLLRHAHAGDPMSWTGSDDERPLSAKGERQADRLGRFLASVGFSPDTILSSPRVRARQTAELVAGHLAVAVAIEPRLAEPIGLEDLAAILRDAGAPARPVLVGHDPDFTDLVAELSGAAEIPLRKGALARIDLDGPIRPGEGVLRWLIPPDLLKPDS